MNLAELNSRIKSAITVLKEGHAFKVGELLFSSENNFTLTVTGWTTNTSLSAITKTSALIELEEIKNLFSVMCEAANELATFIKDRRVEYYLAFDYGKGGINICKEIEGNITWETNLLL